MVAWVKVLDAKPDDLLWTPGARVKVEDRTNSPVHCPLTSTHAPWRTLVYCVHVHKCIYIQDKSRNNEIIVVLPFSVCICMYMMWIYVCICIFVWEHVCKCHVHLYVRRPSQVLIVALHLVWNGVSVWAASLPSTLACELRVPLPPFSSEEHWDYKYRPLCFTVRFRD